MTSDVCKPDESGDGVTCDSRFVNRIVLHLGDGDDRLTGYSMAGGPGDDHFWTKDATKDFVLGGPGSDTADAEPDDVLTGVETRSGG